MRQRAHRPSLLDDSKGWQDDKVMDTLTHAIILDFEATCDNKSQPKPQEIIEFPSVLLSLDDLEVVDTFESFVRPRHHPKLSKFCRDFTGIQQSDIDQAASFGDVLHAHEQWLSHHGVTAANAIMVTCGDWDLGTMLPLQCKVATPPITTLNPIYLRWQNIKKTFCAVLNRKRAPGMAGMLRALDLPLEGQHHRGIDDCRNIGALFQTLVRRGGSVGATKSLAGQDPISPRRDGIQISAEDILRHRDADRR